MKTSKNTPLSLFVALTIACGTAWIPLGAISYAGRKSKMILYDTIPPNADAWDHATGQMVHTSAVKAECYMMWLALCIFGWVFGTAVVMIIKSLSRKEA